MKLKNPGVTGIFILKDLKSKLFLVPLSVFVLELINTTCRINKLKLTSEKWVTLIRDLQFDQWVFSSIFPRNIFLCLSCRFPNPHELCSHVLEHNHSIIFGMNFFLHNAKILLRGGKFKQLYRKRKVFLEKRRYFPSFTSYPCQKY